jgi:hypothetical protein
MSSDAGEKCNDIAVISKIREITSNDETIDKLKKYLGTQYKLQPPHTDFHSKVQTTVPL